MFILVSLILLAHVKLFVSKYSLIALCTFSLSDMSLSVNSAGNTRVYQYHFLDFKLSFLCFAIHTYLYPAITC